MNRFNLHQTPDEIIKSAPPAARILWNNLLLLCGEKLSISALYYQGAGAGTEFLTYAAGKLYLAYELDSSTNGTGTDSIIITYNEANVLSHYIHNVSGYWDATAAGARGYLNNCFSSNLYFARIAISGNITIKFIGYRIIYT
jgi:hypothetical protein